MQLLWLCYKLQLELSIRFSTKIFHMYTVPSSFPSPRSPLPLSVILLYSPLIPFQDGKSFASGSSASGGTEAYAYFLDRVRAHLHVV